MEKWQLTHIRCNLDMLILSTNVSEIFISKLHKIFSPADEDDLKSKESSHATCNLLYKLACERVNGYETLAKALYETNQTGALSILISGFISNVFESCGISVNVSDEILTVLVKEFSHAVLRCEVQFQCNNVPLEQVLGELNINTAQNLVKNHLKGKFLVDLINNNQPVLLNNTVPNPLSYYIARKLKAHRLVHPNAFLKYCDDVFVITNIQAHELSLYVETENIDGSGNQTDEISSRFIILEYEHDYRKICEISVLVPVHLLKFTNGEFIWVESQGSISNLQHHVQYVETPINEQEFLNSCLKTSVPICISDTPGMGKSVLLQNLANNILRKIPNRLVRLFVFTEFVSKVLVKEKLINKITEDFLLNLIAEQSSEFEIGRNIVKEMLKSKAVTVELMFDGFDEVLLTQVETCRHILRVLNTFPSVRLYVATRPHMKESLESTLNVLGYTMLPFGELDQVEFLRSYWNTQGGANLNEWLTEFAKTCLQALQQNMNDFEQRMTGIPLQCRLLADVYEYKAVKYSKPETKLTDDEISEVINIRSIFDVYKKLAEMRFKKHIATEGNSWLLTFKIFKENPEKKRVKVINAHILHSLKLFFPEWFYDGDVARRLVKGIAGRNQIQLHLLYAFGFLEENNNTSRFVHRTFAEYFLGRFIATALMYPSKEEKHFHYYCLKKVTSTLMLEKPLLNSFKKSNSCIIYTFLQPVICYFINAHVKHLEKEIDKQKCLIEIPFDHTTLVNILTACIVHDYSCFFKLIIQNNTFSVNQITVWLYIAARYSNEEIMKTICELLQVKGPCQTFMNHFPEFVISPLHIAVERGHFILTKYLLRNPKIKNLFCKTDEESKFLLHCCVTESLHDSDVVISRKMQILSLLSKTNKLWLNEQLPDGCTPLLSSQVHANLIKCLVTLGADVNVVNKHGCVLHKLLEHEISPEDYHNVVSLLCAHGFRQLNALDYQQRTPLHVAFQKIELLADTINLYEKGDFTLVDKSGDNVLFYAVRGGRSLNLIKKLLSIGVSVNHANYNHQCVLDICTKSLNFPAFEYFLKAHKIEAYMSGVQSENCYRNPFVQILKVGKGLNVKFIKLMEEYGGLKITVQLASEALFSLICEANIVTWKLNANYCHVLDYLVEKGGEITCRNGINPWKMTATQRYLPILVQVTQSTTKLLTELKKRQALTPLSSFENQSDALFDALQTSRTGTFEKLCISLIACNQLAAFMILKQCLISSIVEDLIFLTPPSGLIELIQSGPVNVVLLRSKNQKLTIMRLQNTVDRDLVLLNQKILNSELLQEQNLLIYQCDFATYDEIKNLHSLGRKTICICTDFDSRITDRHLCPILMEHVGWHDFSTYFQDTLAPFIDDVATFAQNEPLNHNLLQPDSELLIKFTEIISTSIFGSRARKLK